MVVDGTKYFSCCHQYALLPGVPGLVCFKCELHRAELPLKQGRKSLLFFPAKGTQINIDTAKVVNG